MDTCACPVDSSHVQALQPKRIDGERCAVCGRIIRTKSHTHEEHMTTLESPSILETFAADSPHLARISGRFAVEGARSRNKRVYTNVARWAKRAQQKIDAGGIVDMMSFHDPSQNVREVVAKVTVVNPDGTYESTIARTAAGHDLVNQIRGGYIKHVSLRGYGTKSRVIPANESPDGSPDWTEVSDLDLCGIDFTNNPGIAVASVSLAESAGQETTIDTFDLQERDFTAAERTKAAEEGAAMPDGSFPIYTQKDLEDAARLAGHAKGNSVAAVRAHIEKRAKALGLSLPDSLTKESTMEDQTTDEATVTPTEQNAFQALAESMMAQAGIEREIKESAAQAAPRAIDQNTAVLQAQIAALTEQNANLAKKLEVLSEPASAPASAATPAAAAESTEQPAAQTTEESSQAPAELEEAGKQISKANLTHLQAMHDHVAQMAKNAGSPVCPGDKDMDGQTDSSDPADESATPAAVTESTDVPALVASLVETRMATERQRFEEAVTAVKAEYEQKVAEILNVRRKSVSGAKLTETAKTAEAGEANADRDVTPDDFLAYARAAGYNY